MTSARAPRNTSAQPGDRYGVTSRCLGNDHDISVVGSWRDVTLPLRKTKQTYSLETCYEHNMLPLLHAVCLKVLVFFQLHFPSLVACGQSTALKDVTIEPQWMCDLQQSAAKKHKQMDSFIDFEFIACSCYSSGSQAVK